MYLVKECISDVQVQCGIPGQLVKGGYQQFTEKVVKLLHFGDEDLFFDIWITRDEEGTIVAIEINGKKLPEVYNEEYESTLDETA